MIGTIRFRLLASVTAVALVLPHVARAADPAAAQALFSEGRRLMQERRFDEACAKLEESQRLDAGMGTLFQLASCHQQQGKKATAWAEFLEVAAQAKAAGQGARERVAREHANSIEPFLSRLAITVRSTDVPGLVIERDGVAVGRAQLGTAIPIDPGDHTVVARAPGYDEWRTTVNVPDDGKIMTVEVPPLTKARHMVIVTAPPPKPEPPLAPAAGPITRRFIPPPQAPETIDASRGNGQRAAGIFLALAGFGGLAAGAALDIDASFRRDRATPHCFGGACDATGNNLRDEARQENNIGTVALVAGGAAFIGGVVLFTTAPKPAVKIVGNVTATPIAGPGTTGVVLRGSF